MRETRMTDYVGKLKEMYPDFSEKEIKSIIKQGCRSIASITTKKGDCINLESPKKKVKFLIYHYKKKREKSSSQYTK